MKKRKQILLIEPHSDDAWLNLGGFILKNKEESDITVVTVFKDKDKPNFTKILADKVGFKHYDLGLINMEREDFKTKETIREKFYQLNKINYNTILTLIVKKIGQKKLHNSEMYIPMGRRDANHNIVSTICGADYYYREIPYYWNRNHWKNATGYIEMEEYGEFNEISLELDKDTLKNKWKMFDKIYRHKLGMFRWFKPFYKDVTDEVVFMKND
jgi:hypothetical protein